MYRKILVPTDGSVLSEKAITAAIEFARKHPGCRIIGFSVAEPLSFNQIESLTKSGESDYMVREQLSAQSRVNRIAELAQAAGVPCETVVAQSTKPHEEIVRASNDYDCDCIFMASNGRKGSEQTLHWQRNAKSSRHSPGSGSCLSLSPVCQPFICHFPAVSEEAARL